MREADYLPGGVRVTVITKDDLVVAFRKTLSDKGYSEEQIVRMAEEIITLFGFDNSVVDNRLRPEERDMFYKLEEVGLMHTQQEEVTIAKGKNWRLHYWFLNRKLIMQLSRGEDKSSGAEEFSCYSDIDEDVWSRHSDTESK